MTGWGRMMEGDNQNSAWDDFHDAWNWVTGWLEAGLAGTGDAGLKAQTNSLRLSDGCGGDTT